MIIQDAHNNGSVVAFEPSADGRPTVLFASGGTEGGVRVWRIPDGAAHARWQAHDGPVSGLAFTGRSGHLLSAGYDGAIIEWDVNGRLRRRIQTPGPIRHMVSAEGRIVSGHADGTVRVWAAADLSLIAEYRAHRGAVRAVAYHPASGQFASSGADGQVLVWGPAGQPQPLPAPPTDAHALAFSPDGRWLTGGGWFRLFQWSLATRTLRVLATEHHGIIKAIDYDRSGTALASISRETDSAVYLLDPQTGAVLERFDPHELCGGAVRLSPDGRYLATTSDDASVRLWDLARPSTAPTVLIAAEPDN